MRAFGLAFFHSYQSTVNGILLKQESHHSAHKFITCLNATHGLKREARRQHTVITGISDPGTLTTTLEHERHESIIKRNKDIGARHCIALLIYGTRYTEYPAHITHNPRLGKFIDRSAVVTTENIAHKSPVSIGLCHITGNKGTTYKKVSTRRTIGTQLILQFLRECLIRTVIPKIRTLLTLFLHTQYKINRLVVAEFDRTAHDSLTTA